MNHYEEVQKYENQIARKKYIGPRLPELKDRRTELLTRVAELEKKKLSEDKDVDRISGRSLSSFVYAMIGRRDEVLDKEKRQAYEATMKYNAAVAELEDVDREIHQMEYDLGCYVNAEKNYDEALRNWMKDVSDNSGSAENAQAIKQLQRQLSHIEAQAKEVNEAKHAAGKAIATAEYIISGLEDAHSWGVFDAFIGGGMFADFVKYDQINQVEKDACQLQSDLWRLNKELKDISVSANISPVITEGLMFADIFFDGIIFDWSALGKIKKSKASAEETWKQLKNVEEHIRVMEENVSEERGKIMKQLAMTLEDSK